EWQPLPVPAHPTGAPAPLSLHDALPILLPSRDVLHQELLDADRWEFAEQELTHLLDFVPKHFDEPWRRTHGLSKLRSRRDIARVRELWQARDAMARESDIAPSRLLRDRELIALARSGVKSSD